LGPAQHEPFVAVRCDRIACPLAELDVDLGHENAHRARNFRAKISGCRLRQESRDRRIRDVVDPRIFGGDIDVDLTDALCPRWCSAQLAPQHGRSGSTWLMFFWVGAHS
jgi:hypothetical protein